ncbi:hypothetical protein PoB_005410000 [Plakobranchus ocellatus]|uniref:Uncharacterized protein n=1 Tax=Plakobranchus ocellatus TaxID=259542 RepID=A0AAV4C4K2_9GAST|nr:hypothetical protein PoB_005410000 [Plakobranchus ocellatus]
MKFLVCICALTISAALTVDAMQYYEPRGFDSDWGDGWPYRRDVEVSEGGGKAAVSDADTAEPDADGGTEKKRPNLFSKIDAMLIAAANGIAVSEIGQLAAQIQRTADSGVDSMGEEVDAAKVQAAIDEAASSFSGAVAVSALFDEPLVYEASKMDAALCLLNNLSHRAKDQERAGEPSQATLAAISMTSQAIQYILTDTVGIVTSTVGLVNSIKVDKRSTVSDSVTRPRTRDVSVTITWSKGRKRRSTQRNKRDPSWLSDFDDYVVTDLEVATAFPVGMGFGKVLSLGSSLTYTTSGSGDTAERFLKLLLSH